MLTPLSPCGMVRWVPAVSGSVKRLSFRASEASRGISLWSLPFGCWHSETLRLGRRGDLAQGDSKEGGLPGASGTPGEWAACVEPPAEVPASLRRVVKRKRG